MVIWLLIDLLVGEIVSGRYQIRCLEVTWLAGGRGVAKLLRARDRSTLGEVDTDIY